MGWKMVDGGDDLLGAVTAQRSFGRRREERDRERLTSSSTCSLPGLRRRHRRHNQAQPCIGTSPRQMGKMMDSETGGRVEVDRRMGDERRRREK